jgi:hypothetical protein
MPLGSLLPTLILVFTAQEGASRIRDADNSQKIILVKILGVIVSSRAMSNERPAEQGTSDASPRSPARCRLPPSKKCKECPRYLPGYDNHEQCLWCGRMCDGIEVCPLCFNWTEEVRSEDKARREIVVEKRAVTQSKRKWDSDAIGSSAENESDEDDGAVSLSEEGTRVRRHKKGKWQDELKMLRATVIRLEEAQQKKSLMPETAGAAPPTYTVQVLEAVQRTIDDLPDGAVLEPPEVGDLEESAGSESPVIRREGSHRDSVIATGARAVKSIFDLPIPTHAHEEVIQSAWKPTKITQGFMNSRGLPWAVRFTGACAVTQRVVAGGYWNISDKPMRNGSADIPHFLRWAAGWGDQRYNTISPPANELVTPPGVLNHNYQRPPSLRAPTLDSEANQFLRQGVAKQTVSGTSYIPSTLSAEGFGRLVDLTCRTSQVLSHQEWFSTAIETAVRMIATDRKSVV